MLTYHIKPEPEQQRLLLLDQRLLPAQERYFVCRNGDDVVHAIREMAVRGAPAIGVTAAWGCWLAALRLQLDGLDKSRYWERLLMESLDKIAQARPTAVNLAWAVNRMRRVWMDHSNVGLGDLIRIWRNEAENIHADDIELNLRMGAHGAELIADGDTVMTHCNAGSLATAGYGTALGVIYAAVEAGKKIKVIANETRPWLQGARLTAFELQKAGVEVTIACDNACAILMQRGLVQKVVTGADRIAANGDTANKIGTHGVAVMAKHFGIPFYIAAPYSTFDFNCPTGAGIPIEERPSEEVTRLNGKQIAPAGVPAYNFAFDVTTAALISAFVTEHGVYKAPYFRSFKKLQARAEEAAALAASGQPANSLPPNIDIRGPESPPPDAVDSAPDAIGSGPDEVGSVQDEVGSTPDASGVFSTDGSASSGTAETPGAAEAQDSEKLAQLAEMAILLDELEKDADERVGMPPRPANAATAAAQAGKAEAEKATAQVGESNPPDLTEPSGPPPEDDPAGEQRQSIDIPPIPQLASNSLEGTESGNRQEEDAIIEEMMDVLVLEEIRPEETEYAENGPEKNQA